MHPISLVKQKTNLSLGKENFSRKKVVSLPFFYQGLFFLLILAVCIAVPFIYVTNEHTIHFWDQASYHDMALHEAITLRAMPDFSLHTIGKQLQDIYLSTRRNYSDLHTLLISPFILIFGSSRIVYIMGLSLVYLLPFTLILSCVASSLVLSSRTSAFWLAAFITLATPAVWLPTLNGYPDTGSALLICIAVFLYLQDMDLKNWRHVVLISLSLALSVLFRRHFAYDIIAFFSGIALHKIILLSALGKNSFTVLIKNLFSAALPVAATAILMLIFLALLGWPFVERLLYTNFSELYTSYERSPSDNLLYYLSFYGWLGLLLAVTGFFLALSMRRFQVVSRSKTLFVLILLCIISLLWLLKVKQLGFHYSIHFTPWIIIGFFITCLFIDKLFARYKRLILLSVIVLYTGVNWVLTFVPNQFNTAVASVSDNKNIQFVSTTAFPSNYPPSRRLDYDQIKLLLNFLHKKASEKDPIYVAASSDVISADLLWHANRLLYEDVMSFAPETFWESKKLNVFQWVPFADSQDNYPLEKLLHSKFVVVATPTQYHMRKEEQQVMSVVVTAFIENWLFAKDFKLLPDTFNLANHTTIHIYERIRPTTLQTAIQTLKEIQTYMGTPPGGRLDWVALPANTVSYLSKNRDNSYTISAHVDEQTSPMQFLYIADKPIESSMRAKLFLENMLENKTTLYVKTINEKGEITTSQQYPYISNPEFKLLIDKNRSFLLLEFKVNNSVFKTSGKHWFVISNLTIK